MNPNLADMFDIVNFTQEHIIPSSDISSVSNEIIFIFTWLVYGIICQIIAIFGIITNIINIICFFKQGFKESINVSLAGLSISDLACQITLCVTNACFTLGFSGANLSFDPIEVNYLTAAMPHLTFSRVTSWITALITLERCLCVSAPLKIKSIFTTRRAASINVCIFVVLWISSAPVYVVNKLGFKFSLQLNKTILGLIYSEERDQVEQLTFTINSFILPFVTFIIILVCTVTLVVTLNSTTKWREESIRSTSSQGVSNRNKKVAKMVVMISTLFLLCFVPISVSMLALAFQPQLSFGGKYVNVGIMLGGICFLMESINSSANIFIYYHMSTKYRDSFLMLSRCKRKQG